MGRLTLPICLALLVGTTVAATSNAAPGPTPAGLQRFVIVPGESRVTYRVAEVFISEGNRLNIAVGVTGAVRGEILIDRARPVNSRIGVIAVDISQFQSDSARRDNAIRTRWLESAKFPTAEFTPTSIRGMPETYQEGHELSVQVAGNLKVRDTSKPTTFAVTLKLEGDMLSRTATTTIKMTDFGFDPPSIFGILRAENEARPEFRFIARP